MNVLKKQRAKILKVVLTVGLLAMTYFIMRYFSVEELRGMVLESGRFGEVVYVLMWAVLPIGFFPVPTIAFVGGMGYSLWKGSLLTLIGASINLMLMFYISRYLARNAVQSYLLRFPKVNKLFKSNFAKSLLVLFILRVSPIIPYNLINYGYGLTDMKAFDYYWVSLISILPGTLIYVNIGDKSMNVRSPGFLLAIGLLFVLAIITSFMGQYVKNKQNGEFSD